MKNKFLFLGNEAFEKNKIVGIFNLDSTTSSSHTRKYLSVAEKEKKIVHMYEGLPKSFILCENEKIYLAQPSTAVLAKRWET